MHLKYDQFKILITGPNIWFLEYLYYYLIVALYYKVWYNIYLLIFITQYLLQPPDYYAST